MAATASSTGKPRQPPYRADLVIAHVARVLGAVAHLGLRPVAQQVAVH